MALLLSTGQGSHDPMKRLQAYPFRLGPDGEQARLMRRFSGSCRFVLNKALALRKERYERCEKRLSAFALIYLLPKWKSQPDLRWLSESPSQALQQVLKDLDRAYVNFFLKRAEAPRFKKKGQNDSFRYPQRMSTE